MSFDSSILIIRLSLTMLLAMQTYGASASFTVDSPASRPRRLRIAPSSSARLCGSLAHSSCTKPESEPDLGKLTMYPSIIKISLRAFWRISRI
jgi:hypothetical protein